MAGKLQEALCLVPPPAYSNGQHIPSHQFPLILSIFAVSIPVNKFITQYEDLFVSLRNDVETRKQQIINYNGPVLNLLLTLLVYFHFFHHQKDRIFEHYKS